MIFEALIMRLKDDRNNLKHCVSNFLFLFLQSSADLKNFEVKF